MTPPTRYLIGDLTRVVENELAWLERSETLFEGFEEVRQQLIDRCYDRLRRLERLYQQTVGQHA